MKPSSKCAETCVTFPEDVNKIRLPPTLHHDESFLYKELANRIEPSQHLASNNGCNNVIESVCIHNCVDEREREGMRERVSDKIDGEQGK